MEDEADKGERYERKLERAKRIGQMKEEEDEREEPHTISYHSIPPVNDSFRENTLKGCIFCLLQSQQQTYMEPLSIASSIVPREES